MWIDAHTITLIKQESAVQQTNMAEEIHKFGICVFKIVHNVSSKMQRGTRKDFLYLIKSINS